MMRALSRIMSLSSLMKLLIKIDLCLPGVGRSTSDKRIMWHISRMFFSLDQAFLSMSQLQDIDACFRNAKRFSKRLMKRYLRTATYLMNAQQTRLNKYVFLAQSVLCILFFPFSRSLKSVEEQASCNFARDVSLLIGITPILKVLLVTR